MKMNNKIVGVLFLSVLMSCAPGAKPKHPKPGSESHLPPVLSPIDLETPERTAANQVIAEGRVQLEQGNYARASDLFQEAVTLDPTNGAGYYYLAAAKAQLGETGESTGLLEKAEQLLASDPAWQVQLDELKLKLTEHQPSPRD